MRSTLLVKVKVLHVLAQTCLSPDVVLTPSYLDQMVLDQNNMPGSFLLAHLTFKAYVLPSMHGVLAYLPPLCTWCLPRHQRPDRCLTYVVFLWSSPQLYKLHLVYHDEYQKNQGPWHGHIRVSDELEFELRSHFIACVPSKTSGFLKCHLQPSTYKKLKVP